MFNQRRSHGVLPTGMLGPVVLDAIGVTLRSHDLFTDCVCLDALLCIMVMMTILLTFIFLPFTRNQNILSRFFYLSVTIVRTALKGKPISNINLFFTALLWPLTEL